MYFLPIASALGTLPYIPDLTPTYVSNNLYPTLWTGDNNRPTVALILCSIPRLNPNWFYFLIYLFFLFKVSVVIY